MHLWGVGLMVIGVVLYRSCAVASQMPNLTVSPTNVETKRVSKADVEAALAYSKKRFPRVHEDALRVWKDFKSGESEPHYTYRFWGRNMVLWLRKERGLSFEAEEKVAEVFIAIHKTGKISKDAAILLTTDVWSFLVYREGIPDRGKRTPPHQHKKEIVV